METDPGLAVRRYLREGGALDDAVASLFQNCTRLRPLASDEEVAAQPVRENDGSLNAAPEPHKTSEKVNRRFLGNRNGGAVYEVVKKPILIVTLKTPKRADHLFSKHSPRPEPASMISTYVAVVGCLPNGAYTALVHRFPDRPHDQTFSHYSKVGEMRATYWGVPDKANQPQRNELTGRPVSNLNANNYS